MGKKSWKAILFLGAPGSGKGTQGKWFGEKNGFFHCSSGDMMRSLDSESDLGKEFSRISSSGSLLSDDWTLRLWQDMMIKWEKEGKLKSSDCLILDGIPRNLKQAELLKEHLEVLKVIHLSCSHKDELVRRISQRMLEEERKDDADLKVIEKRIQIYEELTMPLLHFYSDSVVEINALRKIEEVREEITKLIN